MEQSTPLTVATGTISSSVAGAFITGTYALAKRRGRAVACIYAASAALNCGVAGATFFSVRGYVVTPLLNQVLRPGPREQDALRETPVPTETSSNSTVTWGAMRLHHTFDSAVSGGFTGGVWNTWRRGTRGALTGMMFGSVFCTVGQLLYNELGVQRVKFVSRTSPAASHRLPFPSASGVTDISVPKEPLFERMIHAIGLKRVSDEEYLAQMREERAKYLQRIAELEAKLQADKGS
ncbi:hypothetical protein BJY52DRAFT_329801 [Lactarius psammicola]|nr:hypothetical protein BJY52DRAFT_329801 [Lactarius psammicola]